MPKHTHVRAYFTPKVAQEILRRLAEGEPLSRICGPDRVAGMPDRITVHRHLREDPAFRLDYLIAREAQAGTMADQILEIADGRDNEPGKEAHVGRDWLRVHARQWLAAVMAPRRFGKQRLRDELEDLEALVEGPAQLDTGQAAARIAAILEEAARRKGAVEEGQGHVPPAELTG